MEIKIIFPPTVAPGEVHALLQQLIIFAGQKGLATDEIATDKTISFFKLVAEPEKEDAQA